MAKRPLVLLIASFVVLSAVLSARLLSARRSESIDTSFVTSADVHSDPLTLDGTARKWRGKKLSLIIDGAKHPEQVPDSYAYRHLFESTAYSGDTPAERLVSIRLRIQRMGLSDADRKTYEATLGSLRVAETFERLRKERGFLTTGPVAPSPRSSARLRSMKSEEDALVSEARAAVAQRLSPAGVAKLKSHLTVAVKRQMRVLGGVNMDHGKTH